MMYFDNAATSLKKPPEVARAMAWAVDHLGNPGRSAAEPAMLSARALLDARAQVAALVGVNDPACVAFTSGCTESVGLICRALGPGDHVVATELEHNAVLRSLCLSGCAVDIWPSDARGRLRADALPGLMRENTRFVFACHGSNLTGNVTDTAPILAACRAAGAYLVLDVAQTLGSVPVSIDNADILCFSGHKALMGPMGTGGIVARPGVALPVLKTGGTGEDTFARLQRDIMPELAEAGTPNVPGLYGLIKGVEFVRQTGLDAIVRHEQQLTKCFYEGVNALSGVKVYGDFDRWPRAPVVSLSVGGMDSAEAALTLWEKFGMAVRAGGHCAPLMHRRLGTEQSGLVRFSFGWYNTLGEVERAVDAVAALARGR